ncbi:hypothetical protein CAPTEDRAFT_209935 [Capitella teleta]|uniref:Retrotransposon gag domain-containing protein n=1 Tax=Capitella teleta TaxID=283909 RepID=R7VAR9_CAPTE|nr:hypothetical protein CAPTEDRAFT_209935 [Capitella teleta]|eukprot:ELU15674.1 hypothetical protein CAPTEDRAFT_209935 [Capitella teleta]
MEYDSFTGPQANETIRVKPEANGRRIRINEFTLESDEGDTESDLEINRDEQDALKFFSAIADVSATERFIKRVGFCDGDKPSRTLEWLRAIDRLPDNVQVEIALQTAESTIHSSLRELKNAKWPKIKTLLANRYVNANFSEAQKEALDRLEQRPGEGLYNYITTFEVLLNEAYQALPLDQTSLIRTFLSGLSDRDMAKSVARKKLRTLPEVVKEVRRHYQDDDLLRPRKISKVHTIDKYENPQVSALSVVVTDLVNMQKETNAQIAALAKEEGERLQAIRLAERILREYRSKQKETYRENEPSRAKRLPPGTFVSVRILNPKKESDEGDTESDLEINRDEQDALKIFSAIADVSATERFIKRVGFCDGDKPSRTLEWLRAIDRLPDNVQVEIALQTAESTIHSSWRIVVISVLTTDNNTFACHDLSIGKSSNVD